MIAFLGIAAIALGTGVAPLPSTQTQQQQGMLPDLVLAKDTGSVVADFSVVEYYPTLKSKIGLASNVRQTELVDAGDYINELGPGLVCSNIEFDYWYKWGGEANPALNQTFSTPGDPTSRPVALQEKPGDWFVGYERMLGELNVSQLVQLTGAPAQYQRPAPATDVHLVPTDIDGAADVMAAWTASAQHPYPVLWSLWNEPARTLGDATTSSYAPQGNATGGGSKASRNETKKALRQGKKGKGKAGKAARNETSLNNATAIADIFVAYSNKMRPKMGAASQFGLASFISQNFNPDNAPGGKVFFDEVIDTVGDRAAIDFVSFNSFNGAWPTIVNGVRVVAGAGASLGPIIFTQFAPGSMKVNENGSTKKQAPITATPMEVSLDMIDDLVQLERATDVRNVCLAYWIGSASGLLDSRGSGLKPTSRYAALKMFMDLPTVRTQLDFTTTGLQAKGVRGLAGRNQAKVAVLLWNQSNAAVTVPLTLNGLPDAVKAGKATLTSLSAANPDGVKAAYDGGAVALPAYGMALVEVTSAATPDPLLRRNSVSAGAGKTRFLQTRSFTDRVSETCKTGLGLPGNTGCARNTGTYGFYDSVRSVAYLGMGNGKTAAKVTASYTGLPAQLLVVPESFSIGSDASAQALNVSANFAGCGKVVKASPGADGQPWLMDFQSVPATCRAKSATLTMTLSGVPAGTQAEIYLATDAAEAQALAAASPGLVRASAPDMTEGLTVKPQ